MRIVGGSVAPSLSSRPQGEISSHRAEFWWASFFLPGVAILCPVQALSLIDRVVESGSGEAANHRRQSLKTCSAGLYGGPFSPHGAETLVGRWPARAAPGRRNWQVAQRGPEVPPRNMRPRDRPTSLHDRGKRSQQPVEMVLGRFKLQFGQAAVAVAGLDQVPLKQLELHANATGQTASSGPGDRWPGRAVSVEDADRALVGRGGEPGIDLQRLGD